MFNLETDRGKVNRNRPPVEIFESLDRTCSHTVLRPTQREAVELLSQRLDDRDIILKMSTGGGKTTIGLIWLLTHMSRTRSPGVFLCPTRLHASHVEREAQRLGVPAEFYSVDQVVPSTDALFGRKVLIITYDKLFNSYSTFERPEFVMTPGALVMDDAHIGINRVRDCFTLRICEGPLRSQIVDLLDPVCRSNGFDAWDAILAHDAEDVVEIPHAIWMNLHEQVHSLLECFGEGNCDMAPWNYLKDHLRWCRCVISGQRVEIAPDLPLGELVPAYSNAAHRLFLTSIMNDEASLVRHLDCSPQAALNPILPKADRGAGERMVVAPSLVDESLDRTWVMHWARSMSLKHRVAVLTPNEARAREWEPFGAHLAIVNGATAQVRGMVEGDLHFVAFANRYDGLDLPDDACRILVLDGVPICDGVIEQAEANSTGRPGGTATPWTYRIEQGLGRAVRSPADYAVVVLADPQVTTYLTRQVVLDGLSTATQAQLMIADELLEQATRGRDTRPQQLMEELVNKCLERAADWKAFHAQRMPRNQELRQSKRSGRSIALADAERQAFSLAVRGQPQAASELLSTTLQDMTDLDPVEEGWLHQRMANYQMEHAPRTARRDRRSPRASNGNGFDTEHRRGRRRGDVCRICHAENVIAWYATFGRRVGALAYLADMKARLTFTHFVADIRRTLVDFSFMIGAFGCRPEGEFRNGPYVIWEWEEGTFLIQVATQRQIHLLKTDAVHLHTFVNWYTDQHPDVAVQPLVVSTAMAPASDAFFPEGTRGIGEAALKLLFESCRTFLTRLVSREATAWRREEIDQLLTDNNLGFKTFIQHHTTPLKR